MRSHATYQFVIYVVQCFRITTYTKLLLASFFVLLWPFSFTLAATVTVNTTEDELDNIITNSKCSLREAIISANEDKDIGGCKATGAYGTDTIEFAIDGTFTLTRKNLFSFDQDTGNLNILSSLTIKGRGKDRTIIDGTGIQRFETRGGVFKIDSEAANVLLKDLTVQNGVVETKVTDPINGFETFAGGGGISSAAENITLENIVIRNNESGDFGGGLSLGGNPTIIDSLIIGNKSNGRGGGGIDLSRGTIINSIISTNRTAGSGAGIRLGISQNGQRLLIRNSLIQANTSDNSGGGIFIDETVGTFHSVSLESVTITGNAVSSAVATSGGGGIRKSRKATVTLKNSIIAGNFDRSPSSILNDCSSNGSLVSAGFNFIGEDTCGGFTQAADIVGSPTAPLDPRLANDFSPSANSPVIDKGGDCSATDLRGNARPQDGDGDGIATCDIGALEANKIAPQADLGLKLEASANALKEGETVTYSLIITNNGPATAEGVQIVSKLTDLIKIKLEGKTCALDNNTVICSLGNLTSLETITLKIEGTVPIGQTLESVAVNSTVKSKTRDPIKSNNEKTLKTSISEIQADVELSINDNRDPVSPNEIIEYTLALVNNGPDASGNLTLNASFTEGAGRVGLPAGCTQNSDTVFSCNFSSLSKGAKIERVITVQAAETANLVRLLARVVSVSADPELSNNEDQETTQVSTSTADISVALSSESEALVNSQLRLFASVTNLGPDPATNVDITLGFSEPGLATNLRFVDCPLEIDTVDSDGRDICRIESLAVNQTLSLALAFQAPSNELDLQAFAEVNDLDQRDSNGENDRDTNTISVKLPQAELFLSKEGPSEIQVGQDMTYRLLVSNLSLVQAKNVVLVDTLPGGASFKTASSSCSHRSGVVTCNLDDLASAQNSSVGVGQSEVLITVSAPNSPEVITNMAFVKADNAELSEASFSTQVAAEAPTGADLSLKKFAQRNVRISERFTYTIRVTNFGPEEAVNATVTDVLPEGVGFKEAFGASCTQVSQTVRCELGSLTKDATTEVKLSVGAPASAGIITNTASVTSSTVDLNISNNEASASTNISNQTANLAFDKTATPTVKVGEAITYSLNLVNLGPDTAEALVVTDILPEDIIVSSLPSTCTLEGRTLSCSLASLNLGDNATFQFIATAPEQVGILTNRASVESDTFDPDESNNIDSADTTILKADGTSGKPLLSFSSSLNSNFIQGTAGDTDVLVMAVRLNSIAEEDVLLQELNLQASGTGNDAFDLSAIRVRLDSNNNGQIDGEDTLLGSGSFNEDNGALSLRLAEPLDIAVDENPSLLISVDISSSLAGLFIPLTSLAAIGIWVLRRRFDAKLLMILILLFTACSTQNGNDLPNNKTTLTYQLSMIDASAKGLSTSLPADITGLPLSSEPVEVTK